MRKKERTNEITQEKSGAPAQSRLEPADRKNPDCTLDENPIGNLAEDLLGGKTRIYNLPREYRNRSAYIYAIRYARDECPSQYGQQYAYTEAKLIERCLLADIQKIYRAEDGREDTGLASLYAEYFGGFAPDGQDCGSVYNTEGWMALL